MFASRKILAIFLFSAGMGFILAGSWIPLKAQLAQYLIHRAWEKSVPTNPWPWADVQPIAELKIPRLNRSWYVMSDSSGEALAFGPGLHGSQAESNTKIVAGHRDTHFSDLENVKTKDLLLWQKHGDKTLRYRVDSTAIIDIRDGALQTDFDDQQLLLVTCYPFDASVPGGPLRYVVRAVIESTKT